MSRGLRTPKSDGWIKLCGIATKSSLIIPSRRYKRITTVFVAAASRTPNLSYRTGLWSIQGGEHQWMGWGLADAKWTFDGRNAWDVAAGVALIEAAGGCVQLFPNLRPVFNKRSTRFPGVFACGPFLREQVAALLASCIGTPFSEISPVAFGQETLPHEHLARAHPRISFAARAVSAACCRTAL
jgi:hypothetical protein